MTIGIGFKCTDGIVLAVDSQYSAGVGKRKGQKLFPLQGPSRQYSVILATAGSAALAKRGIGTFSRLLNERIGDRPTDLKELQDVLEDALCVVHTKHIYPAPADERAVLDFWLLMAAWTPNEGYHLFRTDVTAVTTVEEHTCIGIGSYLGNYLLDLLCRNAIVAQVEDMKPISAYIIKGASDFVEHCGLRTVVTALTDDGFIDEISDEEIADAEEFYAALFGSIRACIDGAININYPIGGSIESLSHMLKLHAGAFRRKQAERKKNRELFRRIRSGSSD